MIVKRLVPILLVVTALGVFVTDSEPSLGASATNVKVSPLFQGQLERNNAVLELDPTKVNPESESDAIIIWNPVSGSLTSGCALSGCLSSGCGGSGCGGSLCALSGCTLSGCTGSGCGGSGCGGSGCVGSGCGGSWCFGSACILSGCGGSGCILSGCGGSGCLDSGCLGSGCLGSFCYVSACLTSVVCAPGCPGNPLMSTAPQPCLTVASSTNPLTGEESNFARKVSSRPWWQWLEVAVATVDAEELTPVAPASPAPNTSPAATSN